MESILLNIVSPDTIGWLRESVVIFFLTFLHEDAAILAAGFAKVEHGLPLLYAYVPVYIGIVCGDVLIYGYGQDGTDKQMA